MAIFYHVGAWDFATVPLEKLPTANNLVEVAEILGSPSAADTVWVIEDGVRRYLTGRERDQLRSIQNGMLSPRK
jgi:hypothetical protein